jgi:ATPase subunit of ABC transporter with duplicated ATPase domains
VSAQLVATGITAGHGPVTLFAGLDLSVGPDDVIGLVGPNGAGKSTLLRILAGTAHPVAGTVLRSPGGASVGYLPQEPERRPGETIAAHVARRTGVADAEAALEAATDDLAAAAAGADDRYADALERWLGLGGADLDARFGSVAARVGLDVGPDVLMTVLSGGQAARVGLASLLLSRFDVLLLDEPTNDLDLAGLELLEDFVHGTEVGTVLVSHDREFLHRTVTEVVELDLHQQAWHRFGGGYESYLEERRRSRRHARERYEQYADTVDDLQRRARTQRGWAAKGVRDARRDPRDPDKFVRHLNRSSSEQQAAKAKRTDRMLERLEVVEEPRREWELRLEIGTAPPSGQVVSTLVGAVVGLGDFLLGPVTVQVDRGDRVAITGPNGAGKTTLLRVLAGELRPVEGTATLGASVVPGRVDQARAAFADSTPLIDRFSTEVPDEPLADVRGLLAKFGLSGEHIGRPASTLSPGERTRAALALLQARGVNLLVLDEPTNHLDLPAIEQLEAALDRYDGTLLLVSHDRRLLDAVRTDRRLTVERGTVTER